jgi:hypothetical protein
LEILLFIRALACPGFRAVFDRAHLERLAVIAPQVVQQARV